MTNEAKPMTPQQMEEWRQERISKSHQAQRDLQEYNNWVFELYRKLQNSTSTFHAATQDPGFAR